MATPSDILAITSANKEIKTITMAHLWYNLYQKWHYQQPHKQVAITSANINIG